MVVLYSILAIVLLFILVVMAYMRLPAFGSAPQGKRLMDIQQSPNYRNGQFQNLNVTPQLTEGASFASVSYEFFFGKKSRVKPLDVIPSMKQDLLDLPTDKDIIVWFGHSSYFMQVDGKRILVDPVFSGHASPVPGSNKSFPGADRYTTDDLPEIDFLFITHDHYDHLDYQTLVKLRSKTKQVICGLGVGAHLERWGYSANRIIEKDWNETIDLGDGFIVHTTPARHFSGRNFSRNRTLWLSFLLQAPSMKIFIGGDSGYDTHFAEIGKKFGPIDLAILENGQYNKQWRYIHAMPEEVLQAATDLNARKLFPVHSSKFALALHPWDEPLQTLTKLNESVGIPLLTPVIGEIVPLRDEAYLSKQWWLGLE